MDKLCLPLPYFAVQNIIVNASENFQATSTTAYLSAYIYMYVCMYEQRERERPAGSQTIIFRVGLPLRAQRTQ